MTHEEFMNLYDDSLRHGWVTSKIAATAAKQKEREKEYNRNYYRLHSDKWNKKYTQDINTNSIHRIETDQLKKSKELLDAEEQRADRNTRTTGVANALDYLEVAKRRKEYEDEYDYNQKAWGDWNKRLGSMNEQRVRENNRKRIELGQKQAAGEKGIQKILSRVDAANVSISKAIRKVNSKAKKAVGDLLKKL